MKVEVASVFLETFLFYSGFYAPLYLQDKLKSVLEIIKLIIRDESVHGSYIGHKFYRKFRLLDEDKQNEYRNWAYSLLFELYQVECEFIEEVYDDIGWSEDVKIFAQYNANKALSNLKFDPAFAITEDDVNPVVMVGLATSTGNHDFFSQEGDGYILGKAESTKESDYNIIDINALRDRKLEAHRLNVDESKSHSHYID